MTTLAADSLDRIWRGFRALVEILIAPTRFYGTYEYTIAGTDGTTVDATPNDTSTGMPPVTKAELRADTIATQKPTSGNLCHILFTDGNPAKPKCVWCQPSPQNAAILGGGPAIVRVGDTVNAGYLVLGASPPGTVQEYFPGTPAGEAAAGAAAAALTPPGSVLDMTAGQTTSGSSKGTCG
jgi:hypothetical protein